MLLGVADSNCIWFDDVPVIVVTVVVTVEGGGGQTNSPCCLLELGGVLTFPLLLLGGVGVDRRDLVEDADEDDDEDEPPEECSNKVAPHDEGSDDIDEAGDISVYISLSHYTIRHGFTVIIFTFIMLISSQDNCPMKERETMIFHGYHSQIISSFHSPHVIAIEIEIIIISFPAAAVIFPISISSFIQTTCGVCVVVSGLCWEQGTAT
jgi:hypothetical protein